jgi:hypothetical protein
MATPELDLHDNSRLSLGPSHPFDERIVDEEDLA